MKKHNLTYMNILEAYFGEEKTNQELYSDISECLNIPNTLDFRHNIRAAQEYLSKKGLLINTGYATWAPVI